MLIDTSAMLSDACARAMLLADHHAWVLSAANELMCGSDVLWQAMCSEWAAATQIDEVRYIIDSIGDALANAPNA